jgi:ABC-type transporter Mla subunit MlaD
MSNERNALKAGLFIIISIALIISIVIGIKGVGRFIEPMQDVSVSFTLNDDIGGLSRGDEVRVGGAKVGVVHAVDVSQDDQGESMIAVRFSMPSRFTLRSDAAVAIQSTVTGVSWLNISALGSGQPLAEGQMLAGKPSALTELFNAVPEIKGFVADARGQTLPRINGTLDTFRQTGEEFKGQIKPTFEKYQGLADTGQAALANIRDITGETRQDFKTTMRNVSQASNHLPDLLAKAAAAAESASVAMEDVKQTVVDLKEATQTVRSLLVTNRGKIESILASVKDTATSAKHLLADLRRNPSRLFFSSGDSANLVLYDATRQFADGAGQLNDASIALRDALKDPDVDAAQVQQLIERLQQTFQEYKDVEKKLWSQVKQ